MITADTITDEQIRSIDPAWFPDRGVIEAALSTPADVTCPLCGEEPGELCRSETRPRAPRLRRFHAERNRVPKLARARCAEILNARAKESK